MSKEVKASSSVLGQIERVRDGVLDYKLVGGKIVPRPLTPCEQAILGWGKCVREGVKISCEIDPSGQLWNWDERALFKVTVTNRTRFFKLQEVTVHLISVTATLGKANVAREPCSPNVVQLPDIRPGGSANTQNIVASWCDGNLQSPPRSGFTLLCWGSFLGTDTVVARALVTFKAVPYFEAWCTSEEEAIVGT
jgi:hypothetical protein